MESRVWVIGRSMKNAVRQFVAGQALRYQSMRFVRALLRDFLAKRRESLSQLGQDFWVFGEAFNGKKKGFFVEIGSADGITYNNTYLLEKRFDWRGICIEANPSSFRDLRRVRSAVCINVCVDQKEGEVSFAQKDLYGGIVDQDTDNNSYDANRKDIVHLTTRTLASILDEKHAPVVIDYCSIDVEGAEDRVMCTFPFERYTFRCMTIERPKQILRSILERNGYVVVREVPGHDVFYVHSSFLKEYEQNIFRFWMRR